MVCTRWNLLSGVLRRISPVRPSGAPAACTEAPRPAVIVHGARDGVRQAGGRRLGTYSLLSGALCIASLALAWTGTGAVALPEGDRLLVTSEGGFLTVVAQEVEIHKVFQAITSRSGSPIILVNPPADPIKVTLTIERQPLQQALPRLLDALRTSVSLSYVIVSAQDRPPWVKIFFPETAQGPGKVGETFQESLHPVGEPIVQELPPPDAPQAEVVAAAPTEEEQEEQQQVLAVLQALGVATEQLDAEQLLELKLRLAQGLLVPGGQELPPPEASEGEVGAAAPTEEEQEEEQQVLEVLQALGVATEQLDAEQLLELKLRLAQGLLVHEGLQHTDGDAVVQSSQQFPEADKTQ